MAMIYLINFLPNSSPLLLEISIRLSTSSRISSRTIRVPVLHQVTTPQSHVFENALSILHLHQVPAAEKTLQFTSTPTQSLLADSTSPVAGTSTAAQYAHEMRTTVLPQIYPT
jgi:hypothetical protein